MRRFVAIWAGQLFSLVGSGLTSFGLAVFLYQETGDIGDLALLAAAVYLPYVLVAPYGGVLADRHDRRLLMLFADLGSAVCTAVMLLSVSFGELSPWTAALLVGAGASCNALQWPAYEASIVVMVPKEQLGRANGLCELSRGASQLLAPPLAGALFGMIGLDGIILLDLVSFCVGVAPLFFLKIPGHGARPAARKGALWGLLEDLAAAFRLVSGRPGLVAMLALFSVTNFTFAVVELLLKPMVLAFGTPLALGAVLSSVGVGMVVGSITMAAWGGPKRKILGILLFQLIEGSSLIVGGARPSVALLCVAAFAYGLVIPLTFGCARVLWQVKIPHEMQGRVTALRNALVVLAIPLGYAVASPLANLFEPLLVADGALARSIGGYIGVGAGRGSALVMIAMGALTLTAAVSAYAFTPYRRIERDLEDLLVPDPGKEGRGGEDGK